jgi:primosomal protein N' (replication factor Y)
MALDEGAIQVERPPLYAAVVVQTSLQRRATIAALDLEPDVDADEHLTQAFHYLVPDALRDQVRLGQLVWVPFGPRTLQGIIVAFDDASPVENTRDIEAIADAQPVLSEALSALAHWISEHYLTPIADVIAAMLPPGVLQRVDVVIELLPDLPLEKVTAAQGEMMALLRQRGPLTLRQLRASTKRQNASSVANQLVQHGWAVKRSEVQPPRVKPKFEAVLRLNPQPLPEATLLGGAHRQQEALEYLRARHADGQDWVPQRELTASTVTALVDKGWVERSERQVWRDPLADHAFVPVIPPTLTPDQEKVWAAVAADLDAPQGKAFLLQGVTGSGKTEIYMRAVRRALTQGRGAIVLVPEIALTPQTIRRFGARFPTTLAVMHSKLTLGERYDQWRRLRSGELRLVIGSRSALFAPLQDLGLIVVDEEHEGSYKQDRSPRYHARDVAVQLAALCGATCILGSATPALESAYRAERGAYVRLAMPKRIVGHRQVVDEQARRVPALGASAAHTRFQAETAQGDTLYAELPPVQVVDMRAELRRGNTSIFSQPLHDAISVALAAEQQVILFLNRRGSATFVQCRDCGLVLQCPRCELPLTYHSAADDLICHHCNYKTFVPPQCPSCWSGRIKYFGIGTQKVEELTRQAFPQARIMRWDLDTTGGKTSHEQLLDQFISGEANLMVGTQMIAKGLDLPRVTLVGVITADTMLNLPDFRAGERTFQLLTQVAGRAGRSLLGGKVIIQSYTPASPPVQLASHHDYEGFYRQEMALRRKLWYPPLSELVRLIHVGTNDEAGQRAAEELHRVLTLKIARLGIPELDLIGPSPAFFHRLRGKFRWQLTLRGRDPVALLRGMRLPVGWRVDVDPVSML